MRAAGRATAHDEADDLNDVAAASLDHENATAEAVALSYLRTITRMRVTRSLPSNTSRGRQPG